MSATDGKLVYTASEARQNFFSLLRLAGQGRDVIIRTKNSFVRFRMEQINKVSKEEKLRAVEELAKLNIRTPSPKKLSKILSSRYDSYLFPTK
ncbi:hypothetical protein A2630_01085 [Candidatus Woesebacteria bacterium RIFCSPHIGHO2_01_FULL_44_10]|uniref:Uncharacterized protein n=1 Tax=Candidatus Woesebacteria bacterium RIFCSPLOWO2_01_FULL_44_14 TaxID=1802525 RepID=A0A1F8C3G4_9BACT|nr:MAG: hypothetical protein A2630_01085 [Candidatus Woesebacteria bacterium RIFCSPHIGHO2_01_FULL_44_10]OGM54718.1 MAG: hypothetical protein A3F62_02850 [Candidatus Woesebacteria bacterium RIFCSPHIGHO2_12_FULL_44_11]OGM70188.1 MAG: hypothetical protein A2975_03890 [Candidatus Woesebacteria bacterium RIFCSPLOWO2_01_FULL_44_14]